MKDIIMVKPGGWKKKWSEKKGAIIKSWIVSQHKKDEKAGEMGVEEGKLNRKPGELREPTIISRNSPYKSS